MYFPAIDFFRHVSTKYGVYRRTFHTIKQSKVRACLRGDYTP